MGEVTQYARQAYLGTGPKGLLRATKGSKLPHPYRGITQIETSMHENDKENSIESRVVDVHT